jgi:hypothetical protein
MKLTLTQTAVEEVSQEPVVSVGKVIFKTSLLFCEIFRINKF